MSLTQGRPRTGLEPPSALPAQERPRASERPPSRAKRAQQNETRKAPQQSETRVSVAGVYWDAEVLKGSIGVVASVDLDSDTNWVQLLEHVPLMAPGADAKFCAENARPPDSTPFHKII